MSLRLKSHNSKITNVIFTLKDIIKILLQLIDMLSIIAIFDTRFNCWNKLIVSLSFYLAKKRSKYRCNFLLFTVLRSALKIIA